MRKDHRAADRYARALFHLAERAGRLAVIDEHFLLVRGLVERCPEITHLVTNSTVALAEKEDFLGKIVPGEVARLLEHFLKLLVRKRRFAQLALIQEKFHFLYERSLGIREVTAVSAVPLSERTRARLAAVLEKKLKAKVRLTSEVDPRLIGGLVLKCDGREINASFRSGLEEMRQILLA